MTINMNEAIAWYQANVGKHTYSMENPRFDCSYSVAAALSAAGAGGISPNAYNTVNLPALLDKLGFQRVYSGPTLRATGVLDGDVVLMSGGNSMADSAGDNGHTGIIGTNGKFYNTTATDWMNGKKFVAGNAVQIAPWLEYIKVTRLKAHTEIWRLVNDVKEVNPAAVTSTKLAVDGYAGPATWKAVQLYLNRINYELVVDGIPGVNTIKSLQQALNAKLHAGLVIDGLFGPLTIKALQRLLGTPVDGVISKPSVMVKALQTALNSGKQWL